MSSGADSVHSLLTLITESATSALAQYEQHGMSVPSLDTIAPHPLDLEEDVLQLRKIIRTLEAACDQLCATLAPPVTSIVNRGQNLDWVGLQVAVQAKIADALGTSPNGLHVSSLGSIVGIDPGKLSRILRMLASRHIFTEVNDNVFCNNRLSILLLSKNNISSLVHMNTTLAPKAAAAFHNNITQPETRFSNETTSSAFMQSIRSEGFKGSFYDWLQVNPAVQKEFAHAMGGLGKVMGSLSILHHFPWADVSTLCDVGSGIGSFSLPLAKSFSATHITLIDLPDIIEQAKAHWAKELSPNIHRTVTFIAANFFDSIPSQNQDIYYIRNIMHNWPDADASKLLCNIRSVMGLHSRILLHEYVLHTLNPLASLIKGREQAPPPLLPNYGSGVIRSHYQDMRMLLIHNAKERTLDEFVALGQSAGLKFERFWDMADTGVIEFTKDVK
ncbi:S-adenosyl-L-methionine-dependent methyltransferase [Lentinula edodes]|uniref:S-adenosyl-L-methionine-dependent methyltransferase n=1 Tax=Lentinula edodes TaxID=5353 RepID=A0A1Q3EH20_LENED|nr:S-adenosyl-L-methionine-dependent methyltransferase [Lentinula edodes]